MTATTQILPYQKTGRARRMIRIDQSLLRALTADGVKETTATNFLLKHYTLSRQGQISLAKRKFRVGSRTHGHSVESDK